MDKGRFSAEHAVAAFRARGRKVTVQRLAILRALEQAEGHPTAEELYARLRAAVPGLALKTVYAILHELAALRLAQPIPMPASATRWEPNTAPHAHFVCGTCNRLLDLPVDPTVLRMTRTLLLVYGQCDQCASRELGRESRC